MGVVPIVCSSVPRKFWDGTRIAPGALAGYAAWARKVAEQERVPFLDLNTLIARKYEQLGPAKVDALFADPHTHTTREGAKLNAAIAAEGLQQLPGAPLQRYSR